MVTKFSMHDEMENNSQGLWQMTVTKALTCGRGRSEVKRLREQ